MSAWVAGPVYVMWQSSCEDGGKPDEASVRRLSGVGTLSPGCGSHFAKSMVRPFNRHGVPVLKRASVMPSALRLALSVSAD